MILHYLRISLRNLRKYKTQTAISICAMAVSLTLMAVVASFVMSIKPAPLLNQPFADRIEQLTFERDHRTYLIATKEDWSLIAGNQLKNAEEIHFLGTSGNTVMVTANSGSKDEHSLVSHIRMGDKEYLKFQGMKSAYSGKVIESIASDGVIINEKLARKLYGKENPIGQSLNVHFYYWGGDYEQFDMNWVIKDVMENPSPGNQFIDCSDYLWISEEHLPISNHMYCYFVLKEGSSREALANELKEIFPNENVSLQNVKEKHTDETSLMIQKSVILFLFLFVLVSFFNYLRQQLQLFRLREREIALRTCVGSQASSLFTLFSTEIMIVLCLTLILSLTLTYLLIGFLTSSYTDLFELGNYSFDGAIPLTLITVGILIVISIIAVALTVRRIRLDQTGLALRMKPRPKHRLRNVGLTVQMTVCILFAWVTVMFLMSVSSIKDYYGIPADVVKYKNCLLLSGNGLSEDKKKEIYDKIESVESVENVYNFVNLYTSFVVDYDKNKYFPYYEIHQDGNDVIDFYNLKIKDIQEHVNPDRYILITEDFKQKLIENNLWNGKTVNFTNIGEFEVKGLIETIPFIEANERNVVIVYANNPIYGESVLDRVILPKTGKENETHNAINDIIREVLPSRIDITAKNFYKSVAGNYDVMNAIIYIIYILSAISLVTTIAGVYAGVSLDTRRRRKEMALRKLNGAGRMVIAMIFLRTYIWIIVVAALAALPLCLIFVEEWLTDFFNGLNMGNVLIAYIIALLLVIAITVCTIGWKIRNIMKVDPVEYLKE